MCANRPRPAWSFSFDPERESPTTEPPNLPKGNTDKKKKKSFQQKCQLVFRATKKHASNLARFATIYKLVMLALKYYGPTPGKEGAPTPPFFTNGEFPLTILAKKN